MKNCKKIALLFWAFIIIAQGIGAQGLIPVLEIKQSSEIQIVKPIQFDSLDVNRKAFAGKNLLQNRMDFSLVRDSKNVLKADDDSIFRFKNTASNSDCAMQLLAFDVDADRYCKATLSLTSTDQMEIYINNKKEKSKETAEDSLSKSKAIDIELTLEPRRYEVIIKRLTESKDNREPALKITLKPAKADSLSQIAFSTGEKRRITINDILEGKRLTSGSLSPTGKYYLITLSTTFQGGKTVSQKELRITENNQTIYRFPESVSPQWISGKDKLVYSRNGQTDRDIVLLDIASLSETVLAEELKYDSFALLPDEKTLILTIKDEIPADKGDLTRTLSPSDRSNAFRGRYNLARYSIIDKNMQFLTFGRSKIHPVDVRFDSRKLLCIASEEVITRRPFHTSALLEIDLQTLQTDTLLADDFLNTAHYSPDGKQILLLASGEAFDGIGLNIAGNQISNSYDNQAFIYDLNTKKIDPVTKNFNPSIESALWSPYDKQIYFRAEDRDYQRIYQYNPKNQQFTLLNLPEDLITSFSLADTKGLLLFRGESAGHSFRLYTYDLKTQKSTLLADPFKEQLEEMALSPVADWNFTSSQNDAIYGRYYLPPNFDSTQKYPMIVYYYAGTSPTSRNFESTYPLQVYAAQGYVVYTLQPSGSTGFGQEFAARHVNAWGKLTAEEIIEGTQKFYREHTFVDSAKIGCIGASYGGFMTQYLQTQTPVFAAAVSHAGISNIASYWGEGYWGYAYSGGASAYSYPWNNKDLYINQSPLFQADKINTPLLLLHGTADTNVPIGESIQMYNALKILGKEVEFIQVQGENHAIYDYKKRIEWNKTIYAWFARWLKGQPEWWDALYPAR
ncbi:MAG: prolyl oligopeptidase family serine peptidase [Dysgonamonadaceae bacterium]|jgi:dipeptidyl aminopeptidase/acylaminoacyl peptidase|nr:prolyl oligopeptidase family serine peptidase [Dysgonamonadaceae bacterium]